jgi:hypothetical protein
MRVKQSHQPLLPMLLYWETLILSLSNKHGLLENWGNGAGESVTFPVFSTAS